MSQPGSQFSTLAACAKCNSRHPFEELSQGHQLCRDCRSSFQVIKCNYCRSEFHNDLKSSSNSNGTKTSSPICKKCEQLEEQHGKPGPCAYCNIIAAFIGTKCQRCTNSEKKYGPPLSCEHCKQKCAFDRTEPECKKKVDNKLLCWLCTMAYKRTLAKARHKEAVKLSSHSKTSSSGKTGHSSSSSSNRHHQNSHYSSSSTTRDHRHASNSSINNNGGSSSDLSYQRSSTTATATNSHKHSSSHDGTSLHNGRDKHRDTHKKPRLDTSSLSLQSSSSMSSLIDGRFVDPNSSNDLTSVVTQLKDQVAILNKKLLQKERELLNKDQQIAELRATATREQRDTREKINSIQKEHSERVGEFRNKIVALQKQLVAQSRTAKPSNYVEPSLVI